MFWIYIPPIIFIAALVVLVVMLGKKTAALKKAGALRPTKESFQGTGKEGSKFKVLGKYLLSFLERVLHLTKAGVRKSEAGLAGILHKMKEKRLGKKIPKPMTEDGGMKLEYHKEDSVVTRVVKKKAIDSRDISSGGSEYLHKEVVVKRKEEPAPQRIVPELAPEDKVKEDALIHRIAENPKDIEAYRELGDYYMSIGNIKDAKDSFKMVLKLRPRDLKAKSSLREIEMKMRLGT